MTIKKDNLPMIVIAQNMGASLEMIDNYYADNMVEDFAETLSKKAERLSRERAAIETHIDRFKSPLVLQHPSGVAPGYSAKTKRGQ